MSAFNKLGVRVYNDEKSTLDSEISIAGEKRGTSKMENISGADWVSINE